MRRDLPSLVEAENRRSVLQFAAAAGGLSVLPSGVSAGRDRADNSEEGEGVTLGDFEDGRNGWKTNGGNRLVRVTEDEFGTGVTSGSRALAVEVDGDAFPMIENKRRVREADFAAYPHLRLDAIGVVKETDNDLRVRFRLHHTANGEEDKGKQGNERNGTPNNKDENVEESEFKRLPQLRPQELYWDMSELPAEVLETANRLEIIWYVEGYKPDGGHRGKATGDFDYRGFTVFDDVRLRETPVSDARKVQRKRKNLHRDHGMIVDRTFEELSGDVERGTWEFVDGTSIPYSFEVLGEDKFEKTIDGETFEIG